MAQLVGRGVGAAVILRPVGEGGHKKYFHSRPPGGSERGPGIKRGAGGAVENFVFM